MSAEESESGEKPRSKVGAMFLSIAGMATVVALVAMPLIAQMPGAHLPELSQWERFLGRFHPVVLHLPIGMFALLLLMELGKLFRRDKGASTLIPAFFTAVTAVIAAVFGYLLYQSNPEDYPDELISSHLWWGIGFASMMIAAFVIKRWVVFNNGSGNWIYILTLLVSGASMTVASHDGGSITHGKNYLTEEAPPEVRDFIGVFVPLAYPVDPSEAQRIPPEDQVVYTHIIQPIFDQKCVSCHGPEKQKGKLRMDSYEHLLAGGKEGDAFEPGEGEDSNIIFRIHLPLDDEEHMPPEGKKQMEPHETEILTWWIDAGALPNQKVMDAEMPEEIRAAVSKLNPADASAEENRGQESAKTGEGANDEFSSIVGDLLGEFPEALSYESDESRSLIFTAVGIRDRFNDEMLSKLEAVASSLVSLDLSGTGVTDAGLAAVRGATSLKQLRLSETEVTDQGLAHLEGLISLESLNLYGTGVTTDGVASLKNLPALKRLYLWQTKVDAEGAEKLGQLMPDTEIVLGSD